MKDGQFCFDDLYDIAHEFLNFSDGNPELWLKGVWMLIEKNDLHECECNWELLRFYSTIYGACFIYKQFSLMMEGFTVEPEVSIDIDYSDFYIFKENPGENLDFVKTFISDTVMHEDPSLHLAFDLLSTAMNSSTVFVALYYTYFYRNYSLEDYETDEYYYGDITDPDELERAREDNSDYEERKRYVSYDSAR